MKKSPPVSVIEPTRRINAAYRVVRRSIEFVTQSFQAHPFLWTFGIVTECFLKEAWNERSLSTWDPMQLSGIVLLLIGTCFALTIPGKLEGMLDRLNQRGVLEGDQKAMEALKRDLRRGKSHWLVRAIVGVATLIYFTCFPPELVHDPFRDWWFLWSILLAVLGSVVALRILRITCGPTLHKGNLPGLLKKHRIPIHLQLGHPDGASGLGPLRQFYSYQAMVIAIPATQFGAWWIILSLASAPVEIKDFTRLDRTVERLATSAEPLYSELRAALSPEELQFITNNFSNPTNERMERIVLNAFSRLGKNSYDGVTKPLAYLVLPPPSNPGRVHDLSWSRRTLLWIHRTYGSWRGNYLLLFLGVSLIQLLAFPFPVWKFHREFTKLKEALEPEQDALSREAASIKESLLSPKVKEEDERKRLKERFDLITQRIIAIEKAVFWPVDFKAGATMITAHIGFFVWFVTHAVADLGQLSSGLRQLFR